MKCRKEGCEYVHVHIYEYTKLRQIYKQAKSPNYTMDVPSDSNGLLDGFHPVHQHCSSTVNNHYICSPTSPHNDPNTCGPNGTISSS